MKAQSESSSRGRVFATLMAIVALNISSLATYDKRSFTGLVGLIYVDKYFESLSDEDEAEFRKLPKEILVLQSI